MKFEVYSAKVSEKFYHRSGEIQGYHFNVFGRNDTATCEMNIFSEVPLHFRFGSCIEFELTESDEPNVWLEKFEETLAGDSDIKHVDFVTYTFRHFDDVYKISFKEPQDFTVGQQFKMTYAISEK